MFNLVYASTAARPFSDAELIEMLGRWRAENVRLGITGLLLYKEGAFIQALEGEEATVRALFAAIQEDKRHYQVFVVQTIPIPQRQFPNWSMGFKSGDEVDLSVVPGYEPRPQLPPPAEDLAWKASVAMRLLEVFAQRHAEEYLDAPGFLAPDTAHHHDHGRRGTAYRRRRGDAGR